MIVYELHATTGYTGLIIPVRAMYVTERAYKGLAQKAFDIYKRKIESDPRLAQYDLRLVIFERKADKDGIIHTVRTTYQDFRLIDGTVTMIKEQRFNK